MRSPNPFVSRMIEDIGRALCQPLRPSRAAILVVLLAVVAFLPALRYGFVWDDNVLVQDNQFLQQNNGPGSFLGMDFTQLTFGAVAGFFYRPLFALTLWADSVAWGQEPAGFHFTNLVLHGLVVGLLWLVATRLSDPLTATLAAGLFAVHPAHSEVAVFISGRVDSLPLVLMLAGLCLFLRLGRSRSRWDTALLHLGLLGSTGLALAAKESAVVLPGLLLAVGVNDPHGEGRRLADRLRGTLVKMAGVLAIVGTYALWRWVRLTGYLAQVVGGTGIADRVWMAVEAFGFYTMQALLPVPLGPERYPAIPHSPWSLPVVLGWASLLGVTCWLRWAWGRRPMALIGLVWYLTALAPILTVLPGNKAGQFALAERWLYAPSAGMMLAAAATVQPWLTQAGSCARVRIAGGILSAWSLVALGTLLWITPIWENDGTLYRYILARNPEAAEPLVNVSRLEMRAGRPEEAVRLLRQASTVAPEHTLVWMNLGLALRQLQRYDEALAAFRKSIQLDPAWVVPPMYMSTVYNDTGRYAEGIALMQSVVRRAPTFAPGHFYLGLLSEGAGRLEDAEAVYREAIRLHPRYRNAYMALARTQVRMGSSQAAVASLEKGLAVLPGNPLLQVELAHLYEETGAPWKARPLWEAVASQSGDLELARFATIRLAR